MDLPMAARLACLQNAIQHDGTCQPKGLMGRLMGAHPEFRGDPGAVMQALMAAGAAVNAMSLDEQRAALGAEAPDLLEDKKRARNEGLKPLANAEGKVVMRFAPNPNGPLSLGHARGVAIISEYARQHDGEVVLRFDDTDPQVKPPLYNPSTGEDAYAWIEQDYTWLAGKSADRIVRASDRIDVYHEHAKRLIESGGAYVCTCEAEAWREAKNRGEPCLHRDAEPAANVQEFAKMVDGTFGQGQAVLRVKTDIQHKDPALRDWTAFRIVAADAIHPREAAGEIGHHVCWPLLDFESAVEDHLQGVSHIIRGKDLMDSTRKQQFLYQHMGWEYPNTLYWGRVKIHGFGQFSTSGMRQGIADGQFAGWDDPRLPTLRALRRRGFDPAAVRRFWVGLGISEKDSSVALENMEAEDGKAQDERSPRFFFVPEPVKIHVEGIAGKVAKPLLHPSHPGQGHRTLTATADVVVPGAEKAARLRLKDLGNIDDTKGYRFVGEELDRSLPILQWLPATSPSFTVLKPDDHTLLSIAGQVEPAALEHVGKVVQFERFGFVRIESLDTGIWLHG